MVEVLVGPSLGGEALDTDFDELGDGSAGIDLIGWNG